MDTILYLYPARKRKQTAQAAQPDVPDRTSGWWRMLRSHLGRKQKAEQKSPGVQVVGRETYFFGDYRLVRVAVEGYGGYDADCGTGPGKDAAAQRLREQLYELTEDPDHTYIVCREPLSFYYGREFREYLQQEWIEHLLRYGERGDGSPLWPDLILLGRNAYLPYVVIRYATALRSVKWYLTGREYREDEEWLTEELEEEYGLIPEVHLLAEAADYGRVRLQGTVPHVVMDFCDSGKICGGRLAAGSIWLDFPALRQKEHRVTLQCPQIRYFSMKKEWKDPRKALEYLDTISKNGYNNSVD